MSVSAWFWGLALALFYALAISPVKAQDPNRLTDNTPTFANAGDQVVVVNTRRYPCVIGQTLDEHTLRGLRCDALGHCTGVSIDLRQTDDLVETWIWVHGNQIPPATAIQRGTTMYRRLRCHTEDRGPVRFVIWSWPSERSTNRIVDARVKSRRTDVESFLLGSFLAVTADRIPTSIVAYSFGARVASGALHLAQGGSLCGYRLPKHSPPAEPYRVVFLAAAVENDGILHNGRYGRALQHADRLLLQNNSRDQALRFFWVLNRGKPTALGHSGLRCAPPHCQVQQFDWAKAIGKDHSLYQYINRRVIVRRIAETFDRTGGI